MNTENFMTMVAQAERHILGVLNDRDTIRSLVERDAEDAGFTTMVVREAAAHVFDHAPRGDAELADALDGVEELDARTMQVDEQDLRNWGYGEDWDE